MATYGDGRGGRARTGELVHLERVAALEGGGGQGAFGVGGRIDGAGGDVELGGLEAVREVVALEELVAGNLPVVAMLGGGIVELVRRMRTATVGGWLHVRRALFAASGLWGWW